MADLPGARYYVAMAIAFRNYTSVPIHTQYFAFECGIYYRIILLNNDCDFFYCSAVFTVFYALIYTLINILI